VVLALGLSDATHHLIGARELDRMIFDQHGARSDRG
jgi:hypothetical protein